MLRTAYVFCLGWKGVAQISGFALGYPTTVLISSSLINQLQSGIRSRSIGRNAVEDAEYGEVSLISSEDGTLDGPVFDLQTGNLAEIDSITCDNDCAIGYGYGGYSQILAADAKASLLQILKNGNGCSIKFEDVQLRQIVDRLTKPAVRYGQGVRGRRLFDLREPSAQLFFGGYGCGRYFIRGGSELIFVLLVNVL